MIKWPYTYDHQVTHGIDTNIDGKKGQKKDPDRGIKCGTEGNTNDSNNPSF